MTDSERRVLDISLSSLLDEIRIYAGHPPHSGCPVRIIPSPQLSLLTSELDRISVRYYTTEERWTRATRKYRCGDVIQRIMEYEIDLSQINITLL